MTIRQPFILLILALVIQTAHYAEHVVQVFQIYSLGIASAQAHGLLGSVFDFEWVHFLYNLGLEIVLIGLWWEFHSAERMTVSRTRQRGVWLLAALALFQGYHSIEHIAKLYQYLFIPLYQSGLPPTPGLLPQLTGWPIFLVHFWLNTVVWVTMVLVLWHLRPSAVTQAAVRA
ncbi:MAG: hypothetical protein LC737_00150 [Chloroflexi bacterium]|nr:hypothetical protein [Chloroflexota bacterium]